VTPGHLGTPTDLKSSLMTRSLTLASESDMESSCVRVISHGLESAGGFGLGAAISRPRLSYLAFKFEAESPVIRVTTGSHPSLQSEPESRVISGLSQALGLSHPSPSLTRT
jgi:hypothetical protein